jgi:hypothetical protein
MTNSITATAALTDRRQFLVGTGAAALAAVLMSRPDRVLAEAARAFHLPHLSQAAAALPLPVSLAAFASHIGSTFVVRTTEFGAVRLTLVEVTPARQDALLTGEAFSMLFEGPLAAPLTGTQQELRHSMLGAHVFDLLPIGRALNVQHYQSVIDTRILTPGATATKAA